VEATARRPLQPTRSLTEGFWAAAQAGRLVIQRCSTCSAYRHYPQPMCAQCHSTAWTWAEVSGQGRVYTFTTTYQPFHPFWSGRTPYTVATIESDEGVRMVTDLPAEDTDRVRIGSPVTVFFDEVQDLNGESMMLPRFRLLPADDTSPESQTVDS
jgi:uncharacterized OB-fold protein